MATVVKPGKITFSEFGLGTEDPTFTFPGVLPGRTFKVFTDGKIVNDETSTKRTYRRPLS